MISWRTWKCVRLELFRNPFLTAYELQELHLDLLKSVSVRTIQHHIHKDLDMPLRRAAKKPQITERMRKKRLAFAKKYRHWTKSDWAKVMWSDESTFKVISCRRGFVRRPPGSDRYDPKYTVPAVRHPPSVMIWSGFSGQSGRAGLSYLEQGKTMNAERYLEVLKDQMLNYYELHGCTLFMHDGAPCHRANIIKKFLADHNIPSMEWPGNSPDLNPIENAWNILKNKVCSKKNMTLDKIKQAIQTHWENDMSLEYFKTLSDSMPTRMLNVIKASGYMTKY